MKNLKYYLLPFLDYALSILICLLFTAFFGSWFTFRPFAVIFGIATTLAMCGFIYSRFWKLSRKNTRYKLGTKNSEFIKFVLPLVILSSVLVLIYILADNGILPFKDVIVKTYYMFPDNLPREMVNVTLFDRYNSFVRFWFIHLLAFMDKTNAYLLIISPFLTFFSCVLGVRFGAKNKEVLEGYVKVTDKIKDKFNE